MFPARRGEEGAEFSATLGHPWLQDCTENFTHSTSFLPPNNLQRRGRSSPDRETGLREVGASGEQGWSLATVPT